MANCVNRSSKEFQQLVKDTGINPIVLAAKVSLWQEQNGLDKFPPLDSILKKRSVNDLNKSNTKSEALTEEFVERVTQSIKETNEKAENFLSNFGFQTQRLANLNTVSKWNALSATDFLDKIIYVKQNAVDEAYTLEASYVILNLLGKKNILRKRLIQTVHLLPNYENKRREYGDKYPEYFIKELIVADYLKEKFKQAHTDFLEGNPKIKSEDATSLNSKKEKSLFKYWSLVAKKMWFNFLTVFFKSKQRKFIDTSLNQIVKEVLENNTRLFNTNEYNTNAEFNLTNTQKEIVEYFNSIGLSLSGSYALTKQGTLKRPSTEGVINDLDFRVPFDKLENYLEKIKEKYPNLEITHKFRGVYGSDSYTVLAKIGDLKIDFFETHSEGVDNKIEDVVIEGVIYTHWKNIFDAKIRIGNQKHLRDLAGFIPNAEENKKTLNIIGQRHFNFSMYRPYISEVVNTLEERGVEPTEENLSAIYAEVLPEDLPQEFDLETLDQLISLETAEQIAENLQYSEFLEDDSFTDTEYSVDESNSLLFDLYESIGSVPISEQSKNEEVEVLKKVEKEVVEKKEEVNLESVTEEKKQILQVLKQLAASFNADFEVYNSKEDKRKAFIKRSKSRGVTVYVNLDKATLDTPYYAYSHIFLRMLRANNIKAYSNLVKKVFSPTYAEALENIKENYQDVSYEYQIDILMAQIVANLSKEKNQILLEELSKETFDKTLKFNEITEEITFSDMANLLTNFTTKFETFEYTPKKNSYERDTFSIEFEGKKYEYEASYTILFDTVQVSFRSLNEKENYVSYNDGRVFKVLPQVIKSISKIYGPRGFSAISFTPITGNDNERRVLKNGKEVNPKNRNQRLGIYNIFAKRLFGQFSLLAQDDNRTIIPLPEMFKTNRKALFEISQLTTEEELNDETTEEAYVPSMEGERRKVISDLNIDPAIKKGIAEKVAKDYVLDVLTKTVGTQSNNSIVKKVYNGIVEEVEFLVRDEDNPFSKFETFEQAVVEARKYADGLNLSVFNATFLYEKNNITGNTVTNIFGNEKKFGLRFEAFTVDKISYGQIRVVPQVSRNFINLVNKHQELSLVSNTLSSIINELAIRNIDAGEQTQDYLKVREELSAQLEKITESEAFVIAKAPYYPFNNLEDDTNWETTEEAFVPVGPANTQTIETLADVTNLNNYAKRKETQISKVKAKIETLRGLQRGSNSLNKQKIKKELSNLNEIVKELENDLLELKNTKTVETFIKNQFRKDIDDINRLLQNPSLSNLYLAKDIFQFVKRSFNISIKREIGDNGLPLDINKSTIFILNDENSATPVEVQELATEMRNMLDEVSKKISKAENEAFLRLLDKHGPAIEQLYPGQTIEEVREELMQKLDFDAVDAYANEILPRGRTMEIADPIAQLERLEYLVEESRATLETAPIKNKLESLREKVSQKLKELGYVSITGMPNFHDVFFVKKSNGNVEYVSRFKEVWRTTLDGIFLNSKDKVAKAFQNSLLTPEARRNTINQAYTEAFNTLMNEADVVDFRYLPEIYNSGQLPTEIENSFIDDGGTYRQELIDKIGQEAYNDIVEEQLNKIFQFETQSENLVNSTLASAGVNFITDLSDKEQAILEAKINAKNPLYFITKFKATNSNKVHFQHDGQMFYINSEMYNNTYIPKSQDYYEPKYDEIAKEPILYEFLNTIKEAQKYITESGVHTRPNTVFFMAKKAKEFYMNKDFLSKSLLTLKHKIWDSDVKGFFKKFFSAREMNINERSRINYFDDKIEGNFIDKVKQIAEIDLVKISNLLKLSTPLQFKNKEVSVPYILYSLEQQEAIADILNVSRDYIIDNLLIGEDLSVNNMVELFQNKALEEQTFDLVTMMKMALSMAADFKAKNRTKELMEALTIDMGKNSYSEGPNKDVSNNISPERRGAKVSQESFYKATIFGKRASNAWGTNFSKLLAKDGGISRLFPNFGFSKNLTQKDKDLLNAYEERVTVLKDLTTRLLNNPNIDPALKISLLNNYKKERDNIEDTIANMGIDYRLGAIAENLITNIFISIKIAYNYKTALINNRFQAYFQGISKAGIVKNGELISGMYRPEAYQMANQFMFGGFATNLWENIRKAGLTSYNHAGGNISQDNLNRQQLQYSRQFNVLATLLETMNVIQDGTDFLAKAERPSIGKIPTAISHKMITEGMYAMQYAEYNNQAPLVLAALYELKLEDGTRIFDGTGFKIYDENASTLTLKPEYRTPENIEKYETWTHPESLYFIAKIKGDLLPRRNGDYTYSGVMPVQRHYVGKGLLALKRYLPMMIYDAWAKPQPDLLSGNIQGGYMRTIAEGNAFNKGQLAQSLASNLATATIMTGSFTTVLATLGLPALVFVAPLAVVGISSAHGAKKAYQVFKNQNTKTALSKTDVIQGIKGFGTQQLVSLYSTLIPLISVLNASSMMLTNKKLLNEIDWTLNNKFNPQKAQAFRTMAIQQGMSLLMMLVYATIVALLDSPDDDEEKEERKELKKYQNNRIEEAKTETVFRRMALNFIDKMYQDTQIGIDFEKEVSGIFGQDTETLLIPGTDFVKVPYFALNGERYGQPNSLYYGDPKWQISARKSLLPSAIRNIDKEEWMLGFETEAIKVMKNKNKIFQAFQTDFKKDRREINKLREKLKKELINEFYPDYNSFSLDDKDLIDKEITNELNNRMPTAKRDWYDLNQKTLDKELREAIDELKQQ